MREALRSAGQVIPGPPVSCRGREGLTATVPTETAQASESHGSGRERRTPLVALLTALSFLISPGGAARWRARPGPRHPTGRRPSAPQAHAAQSAAPAPAPAPPRHPPSTAAGRAPTHRQRRQDPRLPAPGGELGRPEAHGRLRGRVLRGQGRDQACAGQREDRGRHQGLRLRAARQLLPTTRSPSPTSPPSPKEQMREVVAEIDKAIPDDDRVIGLDRVLASVDRARSSRRTSRA